MSDTHQKSKFINIILFFRRDVIMKIIKLIYEKSTNKYLPIYDIN